MNIYARLLEKALLSDKFFHSASSSIYSISNKPVHSTSMNTY